MPVPCVGPRWMSQGIQLLGEESYSHYTSSNGDTLHKKHSWNGEEFHISTDVGGTEVGTTNCPCQGEAGKAFQRWQHQVMPVPSHPSYDFLSLSLSCCLPDRFLTRLNVIVCALCFYTIQKITVSPTSAIEGREVALTLLGQNYHILDGFQHFWTRFAVIQGQDIKNQNLPKSLEEQDASWWVTGL